MDPNTVLQAARAALSTYYSTSDAQTGHEAAEEVVESFQALDEWLSSKGFLPGDWQR